MNEPKVGLWGTWQEAYYITFDSMVSSMIGVQTPPQEHFQSGNKIQIIESSPYLIKFNHEWSFKFNTKLVIRLDVQTEYPKMQLIWQLFDGDRDHFPLDALTDIEKVTFYSK